ncbi:helix-hairpin-helix domain-containing protein [Candidatus Daviesbacteria bacterium]|nr:helix-hairpin-helix domain-containing protein [Candidatus Daviesbacteria bacterium]
MEGLNQKLSEYRLPIGLLLVGGVLLIGGLFSSNLISKPRSPESFPKESIVSQSNLSDIKIDIAGAVNNPGVFTLSKESRVEDAIKLAGGFSDSASKEYVSKRLNLSQKITDGLKIYIPFEGEGLVGSSGVGGVVAGAATSISVTGKVGINSADQASLESLPGIGPVTAKKIIDGRPYASIEELLSKKSVSKAVYTKILELVDLN